MEFWKLWTEQITPEAVIRQRWHEKGRNLKPGDIVLLHDKSPIKGTYQLGIVESIKEGMDQLVRSCRVSYVIPSIKDKLHQYSGGKRITVSRSIQRLTLLLPVEEQDVKMDLNDKNELVSVKTGQELVK